MSPIFYEDSLGEKLVNRAKAAMDAAREAAEHPEAVELSQSDAVLVEDADALERAELAARAVHPEAVYDDVAEDWVAVFGPSKLSGLIDDAGFTAGLVTMPLEAAEIPFAWDPYPPEEMPSYRYGYGAVDRPFSVMVPANYADEAREVLSAGVGAATVFGLPAAVERATQSQARRRRAAWIMLFVFIGLDVLLGIVVVILNNLGIL